MFRKLSCATLIVVGASVGLPAQSALVEDCGPNICYVYEDTQPAAGPGVDEFGLPSLVGDALVFVPFEFKAEALNGVGTDTASSNFVFKEIYAINPDLEILNISVFENGDYDITNGHSVEAVLRLGVTNLNFPPETTTSITDFVASGDSSGQQEWEMTNSVDPAAIFKLSANKVAMSMQNTLTAYTEDALDSAWIQKKLTITVTTVPVPAAVWLFGSALGLLGWLRRRRTA